MLIERITRPARAHCMIEVNAPIVFLGKIILHDKAQLSEFQQNPAFFFGRENNYNLKFADSFPNIDLLPYRSRWKTVPTSATEHWGSCCLLKRQNNCESGRKKRGVRIHSMFSKPKRDSVFMMLPNPWTDAVVCSWKSSNLKAERTDLNLREDSLKCPFVIISPSTDKALVFVRQSFWPHVFQ